jgi:hypothetical protein
MPISAIDLSPFNGVLATWVGADVAAEFPAKLIFH